MRIREFRRPDRNSRVQMSTTNSTDDTRNRQTGDVLGRSKKCSPQYPPDTADLNGLEPANCIGSVADQEGACSNPSMNYFTSHVGKRGLKKQKKLLDRTYQ